MGMSINPSIIIGIDVDEVLEYETKTEKYELHDTKTGKPTGDFKSESKKYIRFGDKEIESSSYSEDIADLLGVEDNPYDTSLLGMHTIDYENSKHILGVKVLTVDANYGENGEVSFDEFLKYKEDVVKFLKNKINYEGEIKVWLEGGVSV